jgi:hypothetical protein
MRAEIYENKIRIIPENSNEEYALRQWNSAHGNHPKVGFVLEVHTMQEALVYARIYRFEGEQNAG